MADLELCLASVHCRSPRHRVVQSNSSTMEGGGGLLRSAAGGRGGHLHPRVVDDLLKSGSIQLGSDGQHT